MLRGGHAVARGGDLTEDGVLLSQHSDLGPRESLGLAHPP